MNGLREDVTSIDVPADEARPLAVSRLTVAIRREEETLRCRSAGARVTVTFALPAPVPENLAVRVFYEIPGGAGLHQIAGVPRLTHATEAPGGSSYHYRMSQWLAAFSAQPSVNRT